MQVYLDAGAVRFGKLLERFERLNIRGCRIGWGSMESQESLMRELAKWVRRRPRSRHIYVIHGAFESQMITNAVHLAELAHSLDIVDNVILEAGNEVNLREKWKNDPEGIGRVTAKIWTGMKHLRVRLLSPSVSNVIGKDLDYARRMLSQMPGEIPFAFHRYRDGDLMKPVSGYNNRLAEMEAIANVAAGRELWVTETGQSEVGRRRRSFPFCMSMEQYERSEDEVARQMEEDLRFWHGTGLITAVSYYQLNDGPNRDEPKHRFGWRHIDDTYEDPWKVVADVMSPLIAEVDGSGPAPEVEPSRKVLAKHRWLHESEKPVRNIIPLGQSLFHALALGMPREHYAAVIDNLAGVVNEARFNMSTLGWGSEGPETQTAPPVVSFKKGGDPGYWGYSRRIDPAFLDEMEWRLDHAVSRGVRPQLTLFWGAFQEMFIKREAGPDTTFHDDAMRDYLGAICDRLKDHPAINLELFNEISHGSHLHMLGRKGRKEFVKRWGGWIKQRLPDHLLSLSGENINKQGQMDDGYNFGYHDVRELDYWNVHFDRSKTPEVEGFAPWVRGTWHLNELAHEFRSHHPGGGYGRNDEPIFLQTKKQNREWPYRWSTLDWRMYGASMFIALCAGVATTIHNQGGFFLGYRKRRPSARMLLAASGPRYSSMREWEWFNSFYSSMESRMFEGSRMEPDPAFPTTEPLYKVARFYQSVMRDFPVAGAVPANSSWSGSPVATHPGTFKAFSLAGGKDREQILITVLGPVGGRLGLELGDRTYRLTAHEITGEQVHEADVGPRAHTYTLPRTEWEHCCILHLKAK